MVALVRHGALDVTMLRRIATVAGLVLVVVLLLTSLLHCGGVCNCPIGYACIQGEKGWRCEPSPMPPTWLRGDDVVDGVEVSK